MSTSVPRKHRGPSEAILATIHLVVFMGGVIVASRRAHQTYVSPFMSDDTIVEFFRLHHDAVLMQAFAVFASAIPLGVYAATAVSRLNFLGVRVAGVTIAEFGGFGTSSCSRFQV